MDNYRRDADRGTLGDHEQTRLIVSVAQSYIVLSVLLSAGCASSPIGTSQPVASVARPCPAVAPAPSLLPYEKIEHSSVEFWLRRMPAPDAVLLSAQQRAELAHLSGTLMLEGRHVGRFNILEPDTDVEAVRKHQQEELDRLTTLVRQGRRVLKDGSSGERIVHDMRSVVDNAAAANEIRFVIRPSAIRCHPTETGLYEAPWDLEFDYMQCSQLRFGEAAQVLLKATHYWYVRTEYTEGWVFPSALGPVVSVKEAKTFLNSRRFLVIAEDSVPIWTPRDPSHLIANARMGLKLPLAEGRPSSKEPKGALRVSVPTSTGITSAAIARDARIFVGHPPFTRRTFFQVLFRLLNTPYGWGGSGHRRDCSRMLMDTFHVFDVKLPRNSGAQALSGIRRIDVGELDTPSKLAQIEQASKNGIVLLYMPGHIMLYVGRDGEHHFAFHLMHAYRVPCDQGGQTKIVVNRATVTSLMLGHGSSRGSFIERISRLILIGATS